MKIIIWQSWLCEIGGVETSLYNLCTHLKDYYDILVLFSGGHQAQIDRLSELVDMEQYQDNKTYECDICIRNSVWGLIPVNIKANRYIEIQHADYMHLKNQGKLEAQYKVWDKIQENVSMGEHIKKQFKLATGKDSKVIRNILAPKQKVNKILKLITCARLDTEKGFNRMLKMADMMRDKGIKFRWDIYSITEYKGADDIFVHKPRFDIWDYIADADYTVLLSDCEGLPYTVQESLQYNTPCIVTDIKGCTELIKDGVNGYVVPLDMKFNIEKILKIPHLNEYKGTDIKEWLSYLRGAKYKRRPISKIKVEALRNYFDIQQQKDIKVGQRFEVSKHRAELLISKGFAKVLK